MTDVIDYKNWQTASLLRRVSNKEMNAGHGQYRGNVSGKLLWGKTLRWDESTIDSHPLLRL